MKPIDASNRIDFTRRDLMTGVGVGLTGLGIAADAGEPKAVNLSEQLNANERSTLAAFGETLLPGATEAGLLRYVQSQLASETPLLFARYLDYPEGLASFYRRGLKALEELSEQRYGQRFTKLTSDQKSALASELWQKAPASWTGPPAPLFYLAVRNDAVDVYYGTERGFQKLGVPYLALIAPPKPW